MIRATLTLLAGGTRAEVTLALTGPWTAVGATRLEQHLDDTVRELVRSAWGQCAPGGWVLPDPTALHRTVREDRRGTHVAVDVPADRAVVALQVAGRALAACGLDVTLVGLANVAAAPPGRPGPLKSIPPPAADRRVG